MTLPTDPKDPSSPPVPEGAGAEAALSEGADSTTEAMPSLESTFDGPIPMTRTIIMPRSLPENSLGGGEEPAHFLVITSGQEQGQRYEVKDQPLILGRRKVDIRVSDPAVSGRHCRISLVQGNLVVEDLQRLVDLSMEKWGRIDVLVNSAGHGM